MGILELAADQAQGAICGAGLPGAGGATQLCATWTADRPAGPAMHAREDHGSGGAINNGNTVGAYAP